MWAPRSGTPVRVGPSEAVALRSVVTGLAVLLGGVAACGFDASGTGDHHVGSIGDPTPGMETAASTEAFDSSTSASETGDATGTSADEGPHTGDSDDGGPTDPVVSIDGCVAPDDDCTCTPLVGEHACAHNYGGTYTNLACSNSFQCCDGAWRRGPGVCGTCLCTETTGEQGCGPQNGATVMCHPKFRSASMEIPLEVQQEMTGLSWKEELNCPPFSELRLLTVRHWTFDGGVTQGELVVHHTAVADLVGVFTKLFDARFPIERMERVDVYGADDDASMAANNSSAFNCRSVTGGTQLSHHSYGIAIDINPVQNPYVSGGGAVYPPAGSMYLDREHVRPGMIVESGPVVNAFAAIEWPWGGHWTNLKDYQHFSETGL
jgi:hypothetical protein